MLTSLGPHRTVAAVTARAKMSNPDWAGDVEVTSAQVLAGWAIDFTRPGEPAEIDIMVDGARLARLPTVQRRPDIEGRYPQAANSGFEFILPPWRLDGKLHVLEARLARNGAMLPPGPKVFELTRPMPQDADTFSLNSREPSLVDLARIGAGVPPDDTLLIGLDHAALPIAAVGGQASAAHYQPWVPYVASFPGGFVNPAHSTVFDAQGALWAGCDYLRDQDAITADRAAIRLGKAVPHVPALVSFATSMRNNYFHWHFDSLAGLAMIARAGGLDHVLLVAPELTGWQRDSLALLGIPQPALRPGLCRAGRIIVASHIDGRGIFPDPAVRAMFQALRAAVSPETGSPRLFISREDATRGLAENEAAFSGALRELGFRHVVPGRLSYREQLALFAGAEVVVGTHGAGLTNLGVCSPGTLVFEITEPTYRNPCFKHLCMLTGLRHVEHVAPEGAPFRIDVAATISALQAELAQPREDRWSWVRTSLRVK